MSQTYAKLLDNPTASIKTSNSINYLQFSFRVYENANIVDQTWDSLNTYTFTAPLTKFSYTNTNDADSGLWLNANFQFGKTAVIFNNGEYVDTSGNLYNIGDIISAIEVVLSFTN
jgi:hypothetical protein